MHCVLSDILIVNCRPLEQHMSKNALKTRRQKLENKSTEFLLCKKRDQMTRLQILKRGIKPLDSKTSAIQSQNRPNP